MRLASFEILVVEIPLRVSVEHALAERKLARNIVVFDRHHLPPDFGGDRLHRRRLVLKHEPSDQINVAQH